MFKWRWHFLAFFVSFSLQSAPAHADAASDGLVRFEAGQVAEAVLSWRDGAAAGDARSMLYLGSAYDLGSGVARDYREAAAWYGRAARAGSAAGALNVAMLTESGYFAAPDLPAAVAWYRLGADLGSGRAAFDLGSILRRGAVGVPADRAGAVAAFERAASLGIAEAGSRLVEMGARAPRRQALVARVPVAVEDAGRQLVAGGVRVSSDGVASLMKAAQGGDEAAAYDVGYLFERGVGVRADGAAARSWYGRAAASRDERLADLARRAVARLSPKQ